MFKRSITVAVSALLAATGLAAAAQAQPYGEYRPGASAYSYDACKRSQTERGTIGALAGGGVGAVIGSNAAARNARTEGALLGGVLGAVLGGVVGNKSAACTSDGYAPAPPRAGSYYDRPTYGTYYGRENPPYGRDGGYATRDDGYATGAYGERYRMTDTPPDANGCTLAESPIYMPDGRVQKRFVRVCRDASGRYAVVD